MMYIALIAGIVLGGLIVFFLSRKKLDGLKNDIAGIVIKAAKDPSSISEASVSGEMQFIAEALKALSENHNGIADDSQDVKTTNDDGEELKVKNEHLQVVNELGQKLTSSLNLQESFDHLYSTVNSLMDASVLELAVKNEDVWSIYSNLSKDENDLKQNHIGEWSAVNNRAVFLEDCEKDYARYVNEPLMIAEKGAARSLMVFPIEKDNAVWGTLMVVSFHPNAFDDFHVEIIRSLLGYVSVAMQNATTHEELNQTKIRAVESEKFKQQFLANMSHEIRTPMNAVMGMTNLILDHNPNPDQLPYLQGIKKASNTLLHIINDVLDLSKIEAGKMELEEIDFSLNDVTMQVVDTINHKAEEKGLRLITNIDESINDVVLGDPVRLNQVLMNLTGNAIKFTEKGSVEIKLSKVEAENNLSRVKFEVIDTGIGIPADKIANIFESFRQAHASDTRKFGGTGLGLSISRQLVEMMGGEIMISSVEGEGTIFYFEVEFSLGSQERLQKRINAEAEIDGSTLDGLKILVIDDNEYNRIVAKDTLDSKSEATTVTVSSAMEGIDLIQREKFDVILMDVQMPDMDGIEATEYIRKKLEDPLKSIPIIALTASALKADVEKCIAAGMDSYLAKPFKTSDLIICIANTLEIEVKISKNNFDQEDKAEEIKEPIKTKVTDMEYLTNFCEGNTKRMNKYIKMFVDSGPVLIAKINEAIDKKDYEDVANQIHAYKTRWIMMGMEGARDLALELEKEIRAGTWDASTEEKVTDLMNQVTEGIDELKVLM